MISRRRSAQERADHRRQRFGARPRRLVACALLALLPVLSVAGVVGAMGAKGMPRWQKLRQAAEAEAELEGFYPAAARLIGAAPDEIAFVENATRAWDMAFYSLPLAEGDTILTAQAEYSSNYLAYLQLARRRGVAFSGAMRARNWIRRRRQPKAVSAIR